MYPSQSYLEHQIKWTECMRKHLGKGHVSPCPSRAVITTFSGFHLQNMHRRSCPRRHGRSWSGRDLISIRKICLWIFSAEVGASSVLGDSGTYICSDSLSRFLGLREGAPCLWGIVCVSPGCRLQDWSLLVETDEFCLGENSLIYGKSVHS